MQDAEKTKIKCLYQRGWFYIIVVRGLFIWGLGTGLLFSFLYSWQYNTSFLKSLELQFLPFLFAGAAFGVYSWYRIRKHYHRYFP